MRINDMVSLQLFQQNTGNLFSTNINNTPMGYREMTIEELAAQNPEWDWSMCINGKENSYKKIVEVSDDIKTEIADIVRENFINNNGMTNGEDMNAAFEAYRQTLDPDLRLSATYTLSQFQFEISEAYTNEIRSHYPNWQCGDSFDTSILDGFDPLATSTTSSIISFDAQI
ncbi:MAG: hypothetical protein ATN35_05090 [Epulopiscium sp. Nele67-Bin004]|nr:MAG: hypothetical protein ATN35_05090 [Epulopiscium sp. Nele67-Bin004]